MAERYQPIEINADSRVWAVKFVAKGKHLRSFSRVGTRAWRVEDGQQVASAAPIDWQGGMCGAVSDDGKWIATGMTNGYLVIWDSNTGEQVFKQGVTPMPVGSIKDVDLSPDSSHVVATLEKGFLTNMAKVWRIATGDRIYTLWHGYLDHISKVKYSPQGDRIATVASTCVRVWDSASGNLVCTVNLQASYKPRLFWCESRLFVTTHGSINELDASTGSVVLQRPLPTGDITYIAVPKHQRFIACASKCTVTFWDPLTNSQLALIEHSEEAHSMAFSPDDQIFAIGGRNGKISIHHLYHTPEHGLVILTAARRDDAPMRYAPPTPSLREWANTILRSHSWRYGLLAAPSSTVPVITIYQVLCEHLESAGHMTDAIECFQQIASDLGGDTGLASGHIQWALDFRHRTFKKSEHLGDAAMGAQQHEEAISHFSTALSLRPPSPQDILTKRSRAYLAIGSYLKALEDANQVIAIDPSLPWGYQMKHSALHMTEDYDNAIAAFETMISKMEQSPNPDIQRLADKYARPSSTQADVRRFVQRTIHHLPRELINTTDGRLYNRGQLESIFESLPLFKKLVSSMTRRTDYARMKREVREYFRYVMPSHKWEKDEPSFQKVSDTSVYKLESSPAHNKLQRFCEIVRNAKIVWAWSDTCCINQSEPFVLREALVAMFKWYEGSDFTVVYLCGVTPLSRRGLVGSIWNTRAWTLQEYIASRVVRFYTEDWTLYLGLTLSNHKDSPEVISEMEEATGVSAKELKSLLPGLSSIREKLRLASMRRAKMVEDVAYSLFGIFSVADIFVNYGEGEVALGRLLANVLTRSGDVSILAWTGESGMFNSCLPAHINVFRGLATSHLPSPILGHEMGAILAASHTSSSNLNAGMKLYEHLNTLTGPRFTEGRMTLPCIAIQLPHLSPSRNIPPNTFMFGVSPLSQDVSFNIYRTDTSAFGRMEIRTKQDLSRMTLYLVHPWLESLLEPTVPEETAPMDNETRARRLVARLRQPFGALLLTPAKAGDRVVGFKRVAADSDIKVQFQEGFSVGDILKGLCTFHVL